MCKTIKQRVRFKAAPRAVYELLADSKTHSAVTGRTARISRKIGGRFSAAVNGASGLNVDLVPARRIVQAWRNDRFPEGIFSMATFDFSTTHDGGTELVLIHRGVPKDLIPETERAWREHYWRRMKAWLERRAGGAGRQKRQ
jgi:uncharacterized protein YndB with AHSA1/START domain